MTPQDRRAQLKVLIGGAHPEGKLDMAAVEELRQQLNQMQSEDSLREFAEQFEEMYYNHGEHITARLKKYSRIQAAYMTQRHLTFIEHQNEILDGDREGEVDEACADILYTSFMRHLFEGILTWASMYKEERY